MIVGANCASCGAGPITRKPCLSRGRQRHDFTPGCVRGRCHGHVSLDFLCLPLLWLMASMFRMHLLGAMVVFFWWFA